MKGEEFAMYMIIIIFILMFMQGCSSTDVEVDRAPVYELIKF